MSGTSGMGSGMSSGMSSGSGMTSGSGGDVGGDGDLSGDGDTGSDLASGLGNATPGAGSNWTPGSTSGDSSNPILGGEDTESTSGSWGNRSWKLKVRRFCSPTHRRALRRQKPHSISHWLNRSSVILDSI